MSSFDWIRSELTRLQEKSLHRRQREVFPLPGGRCRIDGKTCWNFASNDYLGLAGDTRLDLAAQVAVQESGIGARASPLVTGRTLWHAALEESLAQFKQAEAALLFSSGFAANLGVIASLVGSDDVVFCDRLNHASLVDGCRLSQARLRVYPHLDVAALKRELGKATGFRRRLIVTDSVFSMDGDHAPLRELSRLAEEFDAMLLVDDAHGTGVFGEHGTGCLEEQEVTSCHIINVGTLSKAIGLQGGFVTGTRELIDWLWNSARTQVFSTGLAIPICAAAVKSLEIIQSDSGLRRKLLENCDLVRQEFLKQGWKIPEGSRGPIIPLLVGEAEMVVQIAGRLEEQGILVGAIRPPTVPRGTSRLRISLSAAHPPEALHQLVESLGGVRKTMPSAS